MGNASGTGHARGSSKSLHDKHLNSIMTKGGMEDFNLIKTISFEDSSSLKLYDHLQVRHSKEGEVIVQYLRTTPGRILFNQHLNTLVCI